MGTESFDSNDFDLFLYQMPDDVLLENRYQNNPEDVLNLQDLIEPSITELTQSTSSLSPSSTTTSTTVVATTASPITVTATNEEPAIESSSLVHHKNHQHQESPLPSLATVTTSTVTSTLTTIPPIDSLGLTNTSYNQQSNYNYYYCPQGVWPYCLQYCQVHGMQFYPYFNPYVRCTRPGQQVYLSPPPPPPQPAAPLAHQQVPPSVPAAGSSSTATSSSSKRKKRKVQ